MDDEKNSSSSKSDEQIMRDEEIVNESESDNLDNSVENRKRKRYHRHTPHQIQEMETFFKECPHPDDKQRKELSHDLGMEPLQIKFWFQNKRTQLKTQHDRQENAILRAEKDKLRVENTKYREALNNSCCLTCGGPHVIREMSFHEHQLRLENAKLKLEIDRISKTTSGYVGKPFTSSISTPSTPCFNAITKGFSATTSILGKEVYGAIDSETPTVNVPQTNAERPLVFELAIAAMDELIRMAQLGEPLWLQSIGCNSTLLNEDEYFRAFSRAFGPKQNGFKSEASRESVVVMNHANLVEILMDVNQFSNVFSAVVSRATNLQVISSGVGGNYDGALQMMNVEFQVPSPLVQTRESNFLRYCKEHMDGIWVVVDVSLDSVHPTPMVRCRKRPSGCVIRKMPNGYLKVTWVEHVEVEDIGVNNIYKPLVHSGLAFGAKRWVAILEGQIHYIASANALTNNLNNIEGRKSMLKLAQRMMRSFCFGVSASSANTWTAHSKNGADEVKIMTQKNMDDPSKSFGIHLSVVTSFWLPVPPKRVFDFVLDVECDILFNGAEIQEIAHILSSKKAGSRVSFYEVKSIPRKMTILQECRTDPTASYIVYAPVEMIAVNVVLGGGDPNQVALLPSGFAILPDGPTGNQGIAKSNEVNSGGSLLTVAFQVSADSAPNSEVSEGSIAAVNELINCTVENIKKTLIDKS